MMKKTLLTILIILGLSYSTKSVADVKNLPIICKYPDVSAAQEVKDSYSLYNTEIEQMIKKLFENPELILKQGFIDHEARIKKLNLKCPSRARMIKPYSSTLDLGSARAVGKAHAQSRVILVTIKSFKWCRHKSPLGLIHTYTVIFHRDLQTTINLFCLDFYYRCLTFFVFLEC